MPRVDILCSDPAHPVNAWLRRWAQRNGDLANISILRDKSELTGGDFLFLISCHQIVENELRDEYRHSLVIHASDLPEGRGWSPMIWEVLDGAECITVSLLDAEDGVDTGAVWRKLRLKLDGSELLNELNEMLFDAELELMDWALANCDTTSPKPQTGKGSTWRRRTPEDSMIDPTKPLTESFDTIRVSDPERFPAFFTHRGVKYAIKLEKL